MKVKQNFVSVSLLTTALFLAVTLTACATMTGTTDRDWAYAMQRNTQLRSVSTQAASTGKLSRVDFEESIKRSNAIRAELDKAQNASALSRASSILRAKTLLGELETFLKSKGVTIPEPGPVGPADQPAVSKPTAQPKKEGGK